MGREELEDEADVEVKVGAKVEAEVDNIAVRVVGFRLTISGNIRLLKYLEKLRVCFGLFRGAGCMIEPEKTTSGEPC
jgi:hypothetical protein